MAEPHRVLVTGASGFLGSPCVRLLVDRGWEVHGVSKREQPPQDGLHWWRADLLEPGAGSELVEAVRPSHLLHLAWSVNVGNWITHLDNYRWVSSSLELLGAFASQGGRRAVFAGTCAEYSWKEGSGVCSEAVTPLEPATTYGLCKRALSELFNDFFSGTEGGVNGAWARLFFLYGPGEAPRRLVPSVIGNLLAGREAPCSHGLQKRDYLFVLDAAEGLVRLLDSEVEGAINLAAGEAIAVGDLVRELARRLGREELLRLGAIPTAADDPPLLVAETTRQREELDWKPSWTLGAGLEHTIAWWRSKLDQGRDEGSSGP